MRQAQRHNREDQPGSPEEAADDDQLDERTAHDRYREADEEAEEVVEPGDGDKHHAQESGDVAEVGLAEVQNPIGSIDQRHADRDQRRQEPDRGPLQHEAEVGPEECVLKGQDGDRRADGQQKRTEAIVECLGHQRALHTTATPCETTRYWRVSSFWSSPVAL